MPPSPPPPQPPERSGTLLETDDDIRRALLSNKPGQPAASAPKPSPPAAAKARLYRPTQRPPIALLTILDDGKGEGEVVRLRADCFVIGRSEGDFLLSHDQQISARHLEITRQRVGEKYRWVVTDAESSNGLFLRVSRAALADKTEFLVGMGRYRFEAADGNPQNTVDHVPAETGHASTRPLGIEAGSLLQPALVELAGGKVLSRLLLAKAEYWIGRDPACAICRAGDPFVEPRHVRLYREAAGAWRAQNNKTPNGLWLKVPQVTVTDSCSFQIGEQRFRLTAGG